MACPLRQGLWRGFDWTSITSQRSAKIAQYIPRRLPLYASASSAVVPWCPRRIGSLSQRSYRMRGSWRNPSRRQRTGCWTAPRSHARSWCASNWRPSASWSGARTYGAAERRCGLERRIAGGCLLQVMLWGETLPFARRLGHYEIHIRRAQ